jgi:hypothetical protein
VSAFRCALASLGREEPVLGTASTVRAFLLVESSGPWGADALRDSRLPEDVKEDLRTRAAAHGVRVLLVRRHRAVGQRIGTRVFAAWADPHDPWLETTTLAGPELLAGLDLDALGRGRSPGLTPAEGPVFAVCTHGRHDACCAELGRPTAAALSASHPEETWEVSHVGGDRFAANVLVLPDGLYYGRVDAADAPLLAEQHLSGHLDLDRLRGRSGLAFPVQVAEVAARRASGATGLRDLRVLSAETRDGLCVVRLRLAGATYDVRVRRTTGAAHRLTCRAERDSPVPAHEVVDVRAV